MTVKSQCKLDGRIKSMDDVQTCLHYDDSYIGERGYFATDLSDLSDLSNCAHDTLAQIILDGAGDDIFRTPHDVDYDNWGRRFFVPERLLKSVEKKYRPLTINEFQDRFHFGICIILRPKNNRSMEFHVTYNGYKVLTDRNIVELYLGLAIFTLSELFDEYERFENGRWLPFGVLVEEDE